ncbi:MAG: TIGR02186 family protein [Alphaproteobacteria bacterium]|nr:TIGR02186 family protein [Alphaproteobacteria bacterium]
MTHDRRPIMAALSALSLLALALPALASPTTMASGLAEETIELKVNYAGARVVMFAASELANDPETSFGFALIGPARRQTLTRTAGGSRERFIFSSAPEVFSYGLETAPRRSISADALVAAGLDPASAAIPDSALTEATTLATWREAFVQLKSDAELYSSTGVAIDRLDGGLARARITLPPNAPAGGYIVRAVAFRNGELVSRADRPLTLMRGGMDATLYTLATRHGFIYGLLSISIASLIGGIAAWVGRR